MRFLGCRATTLSEDMEAADEEIAAAETRHIQELERVCALSLLRGGSPTWYEPDTFI
jgi:hypothetical protein